MIVGCLSFGCLTCVGLTTSSIAGGYRRRLDIMHGDRPLSSLASSHLADDPVIVFRNRRYAGGVLEASTSSFHSHQDDGVDAKQTSPPIDSPHHPTTTTTTVRLNKVFKATHSRREADRMIQQGRVTVNGVVSLGDMVIPFQDVVALDGMIVHGWEQMNGIVWSSSKNGNRGQQHRPLTLQIDDDDSELDESDFDSSLSFPSTAGGNTHFEYVKYYKPRGVICTTDRRIEGNILDALTMESGYQPRHRVYPVGRLDRASSGLILMTSDGRLPNASLRREQKQPKVYHVSVDYPLTEDDLHDLRSGVVITTVAQRDGISKPLTARTKPCQVTRLGNMGTKVEIILEEGRNRQIRRMMDVLGYEVLNLHRIRFGGIELDPDMTAGDWKELNADELRWVESLLEQ
jgi:23S rRNA pseudouridine2604 synthase